MLNRRYHRVTSRKTKWIETRQGEIGPAMRILIACVLVIPALLAGANMAGGNEIRIYSQAIVSSDELSLSDVAEVQGETAATLNRLAIGSAPASGHSRRLDLSDIQIALQQQGVNLSQWIFRGASQCKVSRPTVERVPVSGHLMDRVATSRPATTQPADQRIDPESLEGQLRTHIAQRLAHLGGTPVIQFNPSLSKLLSLSSPQYRFEIKDRSERLLGMISFEVTIREGDEIKQVVPALAQVTIRRQIVVAARPLNRGQIIAAEDLAIVDRTFEQAPDFGITETGPLVGQRVKRFIDRNERLNMKDIEPQPLVNRNDLVTVWVQRGGVQIKAAAKAVSAGGFGDTVFLQNEASRQKFSGVVIGPQAVEVHEAGEGPARNALAMHQEDRP